MEHLDQVSDIQIRIRLEPQAAAPCAAFAAELAVRVLLVIAVEAAALVAVEPVRGAGLAMHCILAHVAMVEPIAPVVPTGCERLWVGMRGKRHGR
ncbi:hypothetical protein GALL_552310 [mine drainage metagenome]|uniref:Uncharacterized protein n=1 Tax=mine drainage metagenome TaxID=410659 RepID=A0A1J5PDB9_9ZZZZ